MRQVFISLLAVLLFSCAGRYTQSPPSQNGIPIEMKVGQESVVDTSLGDTKSYSRFIRLRREGPVIPGLAQVLVPQGMAYWAETDSMIISNYSSDGTAGALTIIDMGTGFLQKTVFLDNNDGSSHTGHLGGLAVSPRYLWIASGPGVYYIPLEAIRAADDGGRYRLPLLIETETKGSFATAADGVLWIGEFTRADGSYPSDKTHHLKAPDGSFHRAWLAGYKLNPETEMIDSELGENGQLMPDLIISIPDEIQGAVFFDDKILLSASFGRRNDSRLLLFNNPLSEPPNSKHSFFTGREVPVRFLDNDNKIDEIIVPPMSEAVVQYIDSIVVLFESAALKYRKTAVAPLDRLQFLGLNYYITEF